MKTFAQILTEAKQVNLVVYKATGKEFAGSKFQREKNKWYAVDPKTEEDIDSDKDLEKLKSRLDKMRDFTYTVNLKEETTAGNIASGDIPLGVVSAWKRVIDYDAQMKKKFSYFDVMFKSKSFTSGHRGHMTRANNDFEKAMTDHGMEPNATIKRLYHLYPPKHF